VNTNTEKTAKRNARKISSLADLGETLAGNFVSLPFDAELVALAEAGEVDAVVAETSNNEEASPVVAETSNNDWNEATSIGSYAALKDYAKAQGRKTGGSKNAQIALGVAFAYAIRNGNAVADDVSFVWRTWAEENNASLPKGARPIDLSKDKRSAWSKLARFAELEALPDDIGLQFLSTYFDHSVFGGNPWERFVKAAREQIALVKDKREKRVLRLTEVMALYPERETTESVSLGRLVKATEKHINSTEETPGFGTRGGRLALALSILRAEHMAADTEAKQAELEEAKRLALEAEAEVTPANAAIAAFEAASALANGLKDNSNPVNVTIQ
jgi:hypothetical protein